MFNLFKSKKDNCVRNNHEFHDQQFVDFRFHYISTASKIGNFPLEIKDNKGTRIQKLFIFYNGVNIATLRHSQDDDYGFCENRDCIIFETTKPEHRQFIMNELYKMHDFGKEYYARKEREFEEKYEREKQERTKQAEDVLDIALKNEENTIV